jgi:glutamate formiminotransferase/formiminotetrahydrofolate cyclodeaminase
VECVPNFSEGRDGQTLDALRSAITEVSSVKLLDVQADAAHHRSVFTLVGSPEAVSEAAFQAIRVARDRINLAMHRGEHPRMGATDVVPFVPVRDMTMEHCVELARRLGARVGDELGIPVFLYARAASRPERERLPDIRKGEFEGLRDRIGRDPAADPDFGPKRIHPTAGATAIGARPFLVAYNIYLETADVSIAKEIAKKIRTSSGGLPAVQASGFEVGGQAQVSMNLLDIDVTPPAAVYAAVDAEARARGTAVLRSEIVGLVPERAIIGAGASYLKLPDASDHLLEAKIREQEGVSLDGWMAELASAAPVPGGGSAAAMAGTMSAALLCMVCKLTAGRKAYAAVEARVRSIERESEAILAALRAAVDVDARAYDRVMQAYRLPKDAPERASRIDEALLVAAEVPLMVARAAWRLGMLARELAEIGNKNARSDARTAEHLARAAVAGALENVHVNLASLSNPESGKKLLDEAGRLAPAGPGAPPLPPG